MKTQILNRKQRGNTVRDGSNNVIAIRMVPDRLLIALNENEMKVINDPYITIDDIDSELHKVLVRVISVNGNIITAENM